MEVPFFGGSCSIAMIKLSSEVGGGLIDEGKPERGQSSRLTLNRRADRHLGGGHERVSLRISAFRLEGKGAGPVV